MRNFKNNFRRNKYKNQTDRNHQKNGNGIQLINDLQNGSKFIRNIPGRNNHNASKLIEKYTSLAREALSNGDKILSEIYFQHAEHFIRILGERETEHKFNKNSDTKEGLNKDFEEEKTNQEKENTKSELTDNNPTIEN